MSMLIAKTVEAVIKMAILAACAFAGIMIGKTLKEKKTK